VNRVAGFASLICSASLLACQASVGVLGPGPERVVQGEASDGATDVGVLSDDDSLEAGIDDGVFDASDGTTRDLSETLDSGSPDTPNPDTMFGPDLDAEGSADSGPPPHVLRDRISCGPFHCCALRSNDEVVCWGRVWDPKSPAPSGVRFVDIGAGRQATCGVRAEDGALQCWGAGTLLSPPPGRYLSVAASDTHGCAIAEDLSVQCWPAWVVGIVVVTPQFLPQIDPEIRQGQRELMRG